MAFQSFPGIEPAVLPAATLNYIISRIPQDDIQNRSDVDRVDDGGWRRAIDYLDNAEVAIEGAGGDDLTFQTVATIRDFGVTEDDAALLLQTVWNPKCQPPWSPEELRHKVRNVYRYATKPVGDRSPLSDFDIVDENGDPLDYNKRHYPLAVLSATPDLTQRGLIKNFILEGELSLLYGDSNTGKTFVAIDAALAVSQGIPWFGYKTRRKGVLYIASESGGSVGNRVAAYCMHRELDSVPAAFLLNPNTVDLNDKRLLRYLLSDLDKIIHCTQEDTGLDIGLVVIDTLNASMGGGNENSAEDMGAFLAGLRSLRNFSGAHIMVVHHLGKDRTKGARGHSSLIAAVDSAFELTRDGRIRTTKQRNLERGVPLGFQLLDVELGHDEDGDPITSCVVEPRGVRISGSDDFDDVADGTRFDAVYDDENLPELMRLFLDWWADEFNSALVARDDHFSYFEGLYLAAGRERKYSRRTYERQLKLAENEGYVEVEEHYLFIKLAR